MGKDSVDKTQQEIIEEMAKALGHTGDKLEDVLDELHKIEEELESISDINKYNAMVDSFNSLRKKALNRREMLMIHREALGAFKHNYVDRYYPIPNKKEKK
ncbi:MAG: hypothetical protein JXM72_08010 [Deltaproteobacteria bacterium]|nr:hypothetical protein [Deltaproteobacteria bacterium]